MIHYCIQTIAFQVFFLLIYDVFLKKETFFNWNRFYLLTTTLLSLVLPLVKIASFKNVVSEHYIIRLPAVVLGQTEANIKPDNINETILPSSFSFIEFIFYFGVGVVVLLFIYKLSKLVKLIKSNPKEYKNHFIIVKLLNSSASFSFFKNIFLGERLSKEEKEIILKHELIHVKHWHSLDLMYFELLRIIFWFNPLIYIYQNRIAELHEFIADAEAVKIEGKSIYYQNLLDQVFDTKKISFINPFFNQSLIKKRIVMLQKSKSKQIHLFKYALLIPLICGMLVYTSCEKEVTTNPSEALDLSEYSFTISHAGEMDADTQILFDNYIDFLIANPEYVSLVNFDQEANLSTFSMHPKEQKLPNGYEQGSLFFKDGKSYKMFVNSNNSLETESLNDLIDVNIAVPFSVIENVPVFPGCEDLESNAERKACMSTRISKFVGENFNTKLADSLGLTGRQRINVIFIINKNGELEGVRSRAAHPALEAEAIRVIKALPKMLPGEQKGKKVNVPYSLPIVFQVE